jgi:ferredoxin
MAYLGELTALGDRVDVVPEDERGIPDLEQALKAAPAGTAVYCCGPEAMLHAVQTLCDEHLADGELHVERFAAAEPATAAVVASAELDGEISVELAASGQVLTVPPDRSILAAVLDVLPAARYSCSQGYCGACEVTVLEGTPDHRDDVLTDAERESGDTMMICVSRAKTAHLKIDL